MFNYLVTQYFYSSEIQNIPFLAFSSHFKIIGVCISITKEGHKMQNYLITI